MTPPFLTREGLSLTMKSHPAALLHDSLDEILYVLYD